MGTITVETPKAIYKVILDHHHRKVTVPKGLDAFVIEYPHHLNEHRIYHINQIYDDVKHEANVTGNPIFHVDHRIQPKKRVYAEIAARLFLMGKIFPSTLYLLSAASYAVGSAAMARSGEIKLRKKLLPTLQTMNHIFYPQSIISGRNALAAEKCEQLIAPHLHQKLDRKPIIGLFYGAAHHDIHYLLQHPEERRRILRRIRKTEYNAPMVEVREFLVNRDNHNWSMNVVGNIQIPKRKSAFKKMQAHARLTRKKLRNYFRRK